MQDAQDQLTPHDTPSSETLWATALWILDALPPVRRSSARVTGPLRRRKLGQGLKAIVTAQGPAASAFHEEVSPRAPFLFALLWWVERQGIEHEVFGNLLTVRSAAGMSLESAAGSASAAYTLLRAFARARVDAPDQAFSESQIRTVIVRKLVGQNT